MKKINIVKFIVYNKKKLRKRNIFEILRMFLRLFLDFLFYFFRVSIFFLVVRRFRGKLVVFF